MLGENYMALSRNMCFKYDQNLGAYAQTSQMFPINSIFESNLNLESVGPGSVVKITLHRNSYRSLFSKNKLAISLSYDRSKSDQYIRTNNLNQQNDLVFFLDVVGANGVTERT